MATQKIKNIYAEAYRLSETLGFCIIPLGKDKRPLLKSWKEFQTRKSTVEEVEAWWTTWPAANIGIVTGKISGITVVDVDVHKGADPKPFPKTYTVRTGNGGLQLYYKYHLGLTISANGYPDLPYVDIRSDGGYVVAAPSVTEYLERGVLKGGKYEVIVSMAYSDFPSHLFQTQKPRRKLSDLVNIKVGSRNDSLANVIGTIIRSMSEDDFSTHAWGAIMAINKTYTPPLSEKELEATFQSICKREIKQRRNGIPSPLQISATEKIEIILRKNNNNQSYKDIVNTIMVLEKHPDTAGKIVYDEFLQEIKIDGNTYSDDELLKLQCLIQKAALPSVAKDTVYDAIQAVAFKNKYDSAQTWIKSLKWDGKDRLFHWLSRSTGCPMEPYYYGVATQWFMGMIRRIMEPGCIFDYVLVLIGPQGIGKTSLFRILGGPWYKSFTGTVENKDFYLQMRGAAIMDLDEGVALYRSESIKIKSIITQTMDEYRAPYDRIMSHHPRRFVFSMSTNDTEPFRDVTGNRRYWPVYLKNQIDFKWLEENREQLFAEAYHHYVMKTKLPEVPFKDAMDKQEDALPHDEWESEIMRYISGSALYQRGDPEYKITISELFLKAFKKGDIEPSLDRLDRKVEMRLGNILRQNGFIRHRTSENNERKYYYVMTPEKCKERKELSKKGDDRGRDEFGDVIELF